jgi:hypothetical protein
MNIEKKQYRQGDVLFIARACAPAGKRMVRKDGRILEGEATGHVHRVAETSLAIAEVYEVEDRLFLSASEDGVAIVHEEHKPIILPAGNYDVVRQREYSPEEIRNVAD